MNKVCSHLRRHDTLLGNCSTVPKHAFKTSCQSLLCFLATQNGPWAGSVTQAEPTGILLWDLSHGSWESKLRLRRGSKTGGVLRMLATWFQCHGKHSERTQQTFIRRQSPDGQHSPSGSWDPLSWWFCKPNATPESFPQTSNPCFLLGLVGVCFPLLETKGILDNSRP